MQGHYQLEVACDDSACTCARQFVARTQRKSVEEARKAGWFVSTNPIGNRNLVLCPEHRRSTTAKSLSGQGL
jgi:hypothetical protein